MKLVPWYLLAALAAGSASAQTPARPGPADPEARVAPPVYRSAFEGHSRLEDVRRADWRESNDEAARIGGHIGILREEAAREKPAPGGGK
jgi:hypothetical protein